MRETVLVQVDEEYEPPTSEVLSVSVMGDTVFLTVCKYDLDHKKRTLETVVEVHVGLQELLLAVHGGAHGDAAYHARKKRDKAARGDG